MELRFGVTEVRDMFDDLNDGQPSDDVIDPILERANAEVIAHMLKKGFGQEELKALCKDHLLRGLAAEVFAGFAGERRHAWLNDRGEGRYHGVRKEARLTLKELQAAQLRVPSEGVDGLPTNQNVGGQLGAPQPPLLPHTFAQSEEDKRRGRSGPGGF